MELPAKIKENLRIALEQQAEAPKQLPPYYNEKSAKEFVAWLIRWDQASYNTAYIRVAYVQPTTIKQRFTNGKRYALDHKMVPEELIDAASNLIVQQREDGIIVSYKPGENQLLANTEFIDKPVEVKTVDEKVMVKTPYDLLLEAIGREDKEIKIDNILLTDEEMTRLWALQNQVKHYQMVILRTKIKAVLLS